MAASWNWCNWEHKFFLREVPFHGVVGIIHGATWFRNIWKAEVLGHIQSCWNFDNKATSSPE